MIAIDRTHRRRWPLVAAFLFHAVVLVMLMPVVGGSNGPLGFASAVMSQLLGPASRTEADFNLRVDTLGEIEYRGEKITLGQIASVLDRDLPSTGNTVVGISVYETTDAATLGQIIRETEKAGVTQIRLSVAKLKQ